MDLDRLRRRLNRDLRAAERGGAVPSDGATIWALDLETTGLKVGQDRIIEMAIVPIQDRSVRPGRAWSTLVKPDHYRADGTPIHGIREIDLDAGLPLGDALAELWSRVGDDALVVHHRAIDVGFLQKAHQRLGRRWPEPPVVDTVELLERRNRRLVRLGQDPIPLALGPARQRLRLPPVPEHRALDDAIATAELWLALTGHPAPGQQTG